MPHGNTKYDKEEVLKIIAEYFFRINKEKIISLPFADVYTYILTYAEKNHPQVSMPAFSQMRKFVIDKLKEYDIYKSGEHITTKSAYKVTECYIDSDEIEDIILIADISVMMYSNSPIICTIQLPEKEILDMLVKRISDKNKKNLTNIQVNFIFKICSTIKKKNKTLILAVIPEFNRMMYLNENGRIKSEMSYFNPICTSLCVFVKNCDEGIALVEEMKKSQPHCD